MTLTEFLEARLAEDEAAAQACAEVYQPPWDVIDRGHSAIVRADEPNFQIVTELDQKQDHTSPAWLGERLEHIARHDPARVLAQCAALRRIVEWCTEREQVYIGTFADDPETPRPDQFVPGPFVVSPQDRFALRILAEPYADHPDYREEWKP